MNGSRCKKWIAACLCSIFFCTALGGCDHGPKQELQYVTTEDMVVQAEQMERLTDWSYHLVRQLAAQEQDQLLVSPLSAALALSIAGQGAANQTADAFISFFLGMDQGQQRQLAAWFLQQLKTDLEGTTKLQLANSVWCDDEIEVHTDFLKTVQQYYCALIMRQDLQETAAVKRVNNWVSQATDGQISAILDEIDSDAVMLLINALALEAQWQMPFDSSETRTRTFFCEDGQEKRMDFLHQRYEAAAYLQWPQGEGIVLPYTDGRLAMVALLPAADSSCWALLEQLSADWMQERLDSRQQCAVELALPKFEMNSSLLLNDACKNMGLEIAFDGSQADFSALGSSNDGGVFINRVLQNCRLQVGEEGTKAAAATVVEMITEGIALETEPAKKLRFDRPFVYFILDQQTGLPIFAGVYQGE